jgi:hypothetical protein
MPEAVVTRIVNIPVSMYYAVRAECAFRRIPIRQAILEGMLMYIRESELSREYLKMIEQAHPLIGSNKHREVLEECQQVRLDFVRFVEEKREKARAERSARQPPYSEQKKRKVS